MSAPDSRRAATAAAAILVASLMALAVPPASAEAVPPGPWDVTSLQASPATSWGTPVDHGDYTVTPLHYDNVAYQGEPTRVFAYYAEPDDVVGPLPAVVLAHGGGGTAFPGWAAQWAQAGYAAIAMDLSGKGQDGAPLAHGGPALSQATAFTDLASVDLTDMWNYQAVAAVIRGVSVLAAQPQVDDTRIGIMGVSWGGYLTEIVAGLDARLAFAIPVYGAGHHLEGSYWRDVLLAMSPADRATWTANFDPRHYLPHADLPMLFANGTNDRYFHLDSWRATAALAPGPTTLRLIRNWGHDHSYAFAVPEFIAFADQHVRAGVALPVVSTSTLADGVVTVGYSGPTAVASATVAFTTSTGPYPGRVWQQMAATVEAGPSRVTATLPTGTTAFYLTVVDTRGYRVTSFPEEVPADLGEKIVDNSDPEFSMLSGQWYTSNGLPGRFGADYRFAVSSPTPTAAARWSPVLPTAATYDVSVWSPAAANRCSVCTYTVRSGSVAFTATADQTASDGQWVLLGSYPLDPSQSVSVELTNQADGTYVQADAVKFELSRVVVVDNSDPGFEVVSGQWYTSTTLAGRFGADYRFAATSPSGTASVRWTPTLPAIGAYEVSVWYPAHVDRCMACAYSVRVGTSTSTVTVDQTVAGGQWVTLGIYHLDPAVPASVQLSNRSDGLYAQADAVRFVLR